MQYFIWIILYTQRCVKCNRFIIYTTLLTKISQLYCFFLSVMPTKDLSPFSYISPQKNPLCNDKVWTYYRILVSKRLKSRKTEKGPPTNPATAPPQKFLSLLRYKPFIGVNEMRVKNITVTVSVRVSDTVRVSLVWFVSTNTFGASSVAICRRCVYKILVAFAQRCVYNIGDFI